MPRGALRNGSRRAAQKALLKQVKQRSNICPQGKGEGEARVVDVHAWG